MSRRASIQDYFFWQAAQYAPIFLPQFLFPPIEELIERNPIYAHQITWTLGFQPKEFWSLEKWWTPVTHMLLHVTWEHLFSNVTTELIQVTNLKDQIGFPGLYVIFFGGGIYATLVDHFPDGKFRLFSWRGEPYSSSYADWGLSLPKTFTDNLPGIPIITENVLPFVNRMMTGIQSVLDRLKLPQVVIGSSTGGFALLGAGALHDLEMIFLDVLGNTCSTGTFLRLIWLNNISAQVAINYSAVAAGQLQGVFYSGHLNGFVFGAGIYAIVRAGQYARATYKDFFEGVADEA